MKPQNASILNGNVSPIIIFQYVVVDATLADKKSFDINAIVRANVAPESTFPIFLSVMITYKVNPLPKTPIIITGMNQTVNNIFSNIFDR